MYHGARGKGEKRGRDTIQRLGIKGRGGEGEGGRQLVFQEVLRKADVRDERVTASGL